MTIEDGNTNLENGEEVLENQESGESQEPEISEEEAEILEEFKDASREDFIKAIKIYKSQSLKAHEKAELYRDLYTAVSNKIPFEQQRAVQQQKDEDEFDDLAKKSDIEEVFRREKMERRNEYVRNESAKFAKDNPDFYDRLDVVAKIADRDRGLRIAIEEHPRPWEYVYDLAVKLGDYEPKKPEKKMTDKADMLKRMQTNANKPKTFSGEKSSVGAKKSVKDMTDEEFEKHVAEVRNRG